MSPEAGPGALSMRKLCALFEVSRQAVYAAGKAPQPVPRRVPPVRRGVPTHELLADISTVVVVAAPNRRIATDLTTVWTRLEGWVAVVLTVDCGCRSVPSRAPFPP